MTAGHVTSSIFSKTLRRSTSTLWGDGFEDDEFRHLISVRDWGEVDSDEYLRVYPCLISKPTGKLYDHVERCLATMAVKVAGSEAIPLTSILPERATQLALVHSMSWAPAPSKHYLARLTRSEVEGLDRFLSLAHVGTTPSFKTFDAEGLVFHTGVHPAYFWPEALPSHQWFTTLGWLGIVMRGRPALLPLDVAEFLLDALDGPSESYPTLQANVSQREKAALVRLAKKRLQGRDVIARLFQKQTTMSWLAARFA